MGRVHLHADGTEHHHDHEVEVDHGDDHASGRDVGDHTGYTDTGSVRVEILENLLSENDRVADANRHAFARAGVRAVNLMSSPGAGKTTLLKRTLAELGSSVRIGVLEGDIATTLDADELEGAGATAIAVVNTSAGFGGECHLDAVMVRSGMSRLPSTTSTSWSSRTWATWSVPPNSGWGSTPRRWSTPSPRARRSRSSTP